MTEIKQKAQKQTEKTNAKQLPRNPNGARDASVLSANEKYRYLKKFIKKGKHNAHILDYTGHTFGLTHLSEDGRDLVREAAGHSVVVASKRVPGSINAYLKDMVSGEYGENRTLENLCNMQVKLGAEAFDRWCERDALARAIKVPHEA